MWNRFGLPVVGHDRQDCHRIHFDKVLRWQTLGPLSRTKPEVFLPENNYQHASDELGLDPCLEVGNVEAEHLNIAAPFHSFDHMIQCQAELVRPAASTS